VDLLGANQVLGDIARLKLGTDVLALLLYRCNSLSILEIGLCWVLIAEGSQVFQLFLLPLFVYLTLLGGVGLYLSHFFLVAEPWKLLRLLDETTQVLAVEDYAPDK